MIPESTAIEIVELMFEYMDIEWSGAQDIKRKALEIIDKTSHEIQVMEKK